MAINLIFNNKTKPGCGSGLDEQQISPQQQALSVMRNYMFMKSAILIFCIGATTCRSQDNMSSYKRIIRDGYRGRAYVHKSSTDTTWRTFLGFLPAEAGRPKLGVISEFRKERAAITWHGRSNVYLVDKNGKPVSIILIGMPDELPVKLRGKTFTFKDNGKLVNVVYRIVGQNLFCVHPSRCYEVVSE